MQKIPMMMTMMMKKRRRRRNSNAEILGTVLAEFRKYIQSILYGKPGRGINASGKALQLAREESDRRKFDGAFAYYAPETIAPLSVEDIVNNSHYQLIGRIWERIK